MGATLQALLELQEIELQIVEIRRQLSRREKAVAAQAGRLSSGSSALAAEREEIRREQMKVDALDLEIKTRSAQISKVREQLNAARTNKEYAALLSQLNTEKADLSRVESTALEMMGKLEIRRAELARREQAGGSDAARLEQLKADLEQARQTFAERLALLTQRRDAAAARLPREALNVFNRVSERYDGEAMARISRANPRRDDFVCEGCNMSVSAERANALLTRDEVQTCKNCGRILYIDKST